MIFLDIVAFAQLKTDHKKLSPAKIENHMPRWNPSISFSHIGCQMQLPISSFSEALKKTEASFMVCDIQYFTQAL